MNRVLVKRIEPVKTQSKIILSTKEETPNVGTVISVGNGNVGENG